MVIGVCEVVKNIDLMKQYIEGEYAMYVLKANTNSFNKHI